MSRPRCFACHSDRNELYRCRLVDDLDGEDVTVDVCVECWRAARQQEQAQLREAERRRLTEWVGLREEIRT